MTKAKKIKKIHKKKVRVGKTPRRKKVLILKKKIKKIGNAKKEIKEKPEVKILSKPKRTDFSPESLFKAKIKVIGIGGGGGSIVSEIGRSLEKATFLIADTDFRALKKRNGIKYLWFGQELTHGLGTGVNVDLARQAAESAKDKITDFFKDQDIVIFVASLGGGMGSGATQVFVDAAKDFGGITFGIFTMPFKFEGKNKQKIAQNALKNLQKSLNVSLVIPNERIFKIINENTSITSAFSTVNKKLIESLESLIDLIYSPGIINIDFADFRTILKGKGNSAFLNTIEAGGKDAADIICENIFKNPLFYTNNFRAEKILFNIEGADNLSMFCVEKISSHISQLNPKAKIIFGISKNQKLKNKIKTTILMTGPSSEEEKKEESAEKEIKPTIQVPVQEKVFEKKPKKINFSSEKKQKKEKFKKNAANKKKNISIVPIFESSSAAMPVVDQKKMEIVENITLPAKKTIRRSALEIRKTEELQEKKKIDQEREWEIPAFLRKVKFKS